MSAKVRKTWEEHLALLRRVTDAFPDRRTGDNTSFTMEDIGLGAFSVFVYASQRSPASNRPCASKTLNNPGRWSV